MAVPSRGGIKKQIAALASPRLSSQGAGRLSRCGRVSRWRRRSGNLLKEVTLGTSIAMTFVQRFICIRNTYEVCSLFLITKPLLAYVFI